MTSSVSPYLQRPVRRLQDVEAGAAAGPGETPARGDNGTTPRANAPATSIVPSADDVGGDRRRP